jgi:putative transposase
VTEKYKFIKAANDEGKSGIAKLCRELRVSKSGYYAWDERPMSKRSTRYKELTECVRKIYTEHRRIPGARKIAKMLSSDDEPVNHKVVARIMKENGLKSKVCKKYKATTNSKHNLPVAPNILGRDFTTISPNQKWLSDITYVATDEGWLYLACVLDLHGREIVGWSMGDRITKELVIAALRQARMRRGNPKGVLTHSDMGVQYCSYDYQSLLMEYGYICSMSRKGNCWDNAPMESFWGKMKQEHLNDFRFITRDEAREAIFWYIEIYYRHYRLHESNGYLSPEEFQKRIKAA